MKNSRFKTNKPGQSKITQTKVSPTKAKPELAPSKAPGRSSSFIEIPKNHRLVMGTHAILEALQTSSKFCRELWLRNGFESSQDLREMQDEAKSRNLKIKNLPESSLDRFGSHQGALLLAEGTPEVEWESIERAEQACVLVLDGLEDPHNLGAILRTAWLMGVSAILIPEDRAVGLTPTVHKVACGGVEHVPIESVNQFTNRIESLKKSGFWVFGLSHLGKKTLYAQNLPEKVVWCIGSEDKGLRKTTERLCDELVSIPQIAANASYNASVATAITLAETKRQMTAKKN